MDYYLSEDEQTLEFNGNTYRAEEGDGQCKGCAFDVDTEQKPHNYKGCDCEFMDNIEGSNSHCVQSERIDGRYIHWVKLVQVKPTPAPDPTTPRGRLLEL